MHILYSTVAKTHANQYICSAVWYRCDNLSIFLASQKCVVWPFENEWCHFSGAQKQNKDSETNESAGSDVILSHFKVYSTLFHRRGCFCTELCRLINIKVPAVDPWDPHRLQKCGKTKCLLEICEAENFICHFCKDLQNVIVFFCLYSDVRKGVLHTFYANKWI